MNFNIFIDFEVWKNYNLSNRLRLEEDVVTLKDIAIEAGVNKSTVSRALNDTGNISESKKKEICDIAKKMGYIPNDSAKILAGKSAKTIGIILPEIDCNYYASVVGSIEVQLKQKGYSLIIGQTGFDYLNEIHYLKLFTQKKVDGIIFDLYNIEKFKKDHKKISKYLSSPIVFIETDPRVTGYDVIEIDEYKGMFLAIEHFVKMGAKSIGFLSEYLSSKIRLPAFYEAMKKLDIPVDVSLIKIGSERLEIGGYLRMRELLQNNELPDAIAVSYDTMAQGALRALSENGLKPPKDVLMIGFDNIRESEYFSVSLTSVSPPVLEMAEMAVERIINRIENKDNRFEKILLQPSLMVRESSDIKKRGQK